MAVRIAKQKLVETHALPNERPTSLDVDVRQHLGQQLRVAYGELGQATIPAHLLGLLEGLERALTARELAEAAAFKQGLLAALPSLRAFAISLAQHPDRADDLVQETILKAWDKRSSFAPGTNLSAWVFTILRNNFHTQYRKRKREVEDADGIYASRLKSAPAQLEKLEVQDLHVALQKLAPEQREALLLVGAEGLPYEEVAEICGIAVGTVKSRVNRARRRLSELMGYSQGDLAADHVMRSAVTGGE